MFPGKISRFLLTCMTVCTNIQPAAQDWIIKCKYVKTTESRSGQAGSVYQLASVSKTKTAIGLRCPLIEISQIKVSFGSNMKLFLSCDTHHYFAMQLHPVSGTCCEPILSFVRRWPYNSDRGRVVFPFQQNSFVQISFVHRVITSKEVWKTAKYISYL